MSMQDVRASAAWPSPALAPAAIRPGDADDAPALHALIAPHVRAGRLLPRDPGEIEAHAGRFVVAVHAGAIVGCAELAPLGGDLAEIRSLVVSAPAQGAGVGRLLVSALIDEAAVRGYGRLCAFTHGPAFFVRQGFSLVPHFELPEKIAADCVRCPLFRACGQQAVLLALPASGMPRA